MAVSSKVGTFTIASSDTVGTTQQITVGFQPKVIFFWTVGHSSATDAITNQTARVAFGVATSTTNRGSVGAISLHASAAIDGGRAYDERYCLVVPQTNPSGLEGALDISAIDSTSFTVIVDDQFPTTLRISYLAIGGSDITNAVVGAYNAPVATGNADITSLAFQPDFLLLFGASTTATANGTSASRSFINIGAASGASNQAVIEVGEGPENNATSQSRSYAYAGEIYAAMADTPTTISSRASFVSFLSNGFRLNWLEAGAAYRVFYVAIEGGLWTVGDLLTQTDTSTQIVESGFGFAPSATMLFSHNMAQSTQDTVQNDARLSIGAFTSASERVAQAFLSETGLADTDITNAVEYDEAYINISSSSAIQGLMDVQSIDSDGITLIMDDADASQVFVWYFSVGATSGTQYTQSASGGVASSGSVVRRPGHLLAGAVVAGATLIRSTLHAVSGSVASNGTILRRTSRSLNGSVAAAGALAMVRIVAVALAGAVAAGGAFVKELRRGLVGSVASSGSLVRQAEKSLAGSVETGAALLKSARKIVAGSMASSGVLTRSTGKIATGTVTANASIVKQIGKIIAGSIELSTTLSSLRMFFKALAGAIDIAGGITKRVNSELAGVISTTAGVLRLTGKPLSGSIATSATMQSLKTFLRTVGGGIAAAGDSVRRIEKLLLGDVSSDGSMIKVISRALMGTISSVATLQTIRLVVLLLAGGIAAGGAVSSRIGKALAASITLSGARLRSISLSISGAVSSVGGFVKRSYFSISGTVTTSGAVARLTSVLISGSIIGAGTIIKRVSRLLSGSVSSVGALAALVSGVSAAVGATRLGGIWQTTKSVIGKFVTSKRLSGKHDNDRLFGSF